MKPSITLRGGTIVRRANNEQAELGILQSSSFRRLSKRECFAVVNPMSKKKQKRYTEEQEREREKRLIAALMFGLKAKKKDPSISKDDIIAAAKAAYKVDPEKSGH